MIQDYVTGRDVPEIGAEGNRQEVERFLVEQKGYDRQDIEVDAPIRFEVENEVYSSTVDLVVDVGGVRYMAVKCVPGSLGSCEREIVAAARLLEERYQIPLALVSDGRSAVLLTTTTGKKIGEGLEAVPAKARALTDLPHIELTVCPPERIRRERLIFRTYNCEYVNIAANLPP
jgi:hypothetical protein